jgi:hypothetical protein
MLALVNDWVVAMRGAYIQPLCMFPYVSVDERVPTDHAIRKLQVLVDTILQELDDVLPSRYTAVGRTSTPPSGGCVPHCCRWFTACATSGCWLLYGTVEVQPAVPLVRGFEHRRHGMGSLHVFLQQGSVVGRRDRPAVLCAHGVAGPPGQVGQRRVLLGRWHAASSLVLAQEPVPRTIRTRAMAAISAARSAATRRML